MHIVDIGLTFLACSALPMHFWGYAFNTIVSIINVLPLIQLCLLKNHSPYHFYKIFGLYVIRFLDL